MVIAQMDAVELKPSWNESECGKVYCERREINLDNYSSKWPTPVRI